tara:strand:- start:318 stop:434 length:117 start_codon:yes stop_codon:yes gene_type:complete
MEFDRFQKEAHEFACYPKIDKDGIIYPAIGLAGRLVSY